MTTDNETFEAPLPQDDTSKADTVLASLTKDDGTVIELTTANSSAREIARRAVFFLKTYDPEKYARYKNMKFPWSTEEMRVPAKTEDKQNAYEYALFNFAQATSGELRELALTAIVDYDQSVFDDLVNAKPSFDDNDECEDGFDDEEEEEEDDDD